MAPQNLDTKAIEGPSKIKRRGSDGTTVVFYSFPDEAALKNIKDGETWTVTDINGSKKEEHPYTLLTANDAVKNDFLNATHQIEGIADIRFYDIARLKDSDREALGKNGITVPATPDMVIYRTESPLINFNGQGEHPRQSDTDAPARLRINKEASEDTAHPEQLQATVLHEALHNLGFRHSFRQEGDGDKPVLDAVADNRGNTVMSYNRYDNYATEFYPQTYRRLDIEALQEVYGKSKHPTPNLMENLEKEETARAAMATTDIPTYLKQKEFEKNTLSKLEDLNDANFRILTRSPNGYEMSRDDLETLIKGSEGKRKGFSKEELEFLGKRDPNLGSLSIVEIEPRNGNTRVAISIQNDSSQFGYRSAVVELTPDAKKYLEEHASEKGSGKYYMDFLNKGKHKPSDQERVPEEQKKEVAPSGQKKADAGGDRKVDLAQLNIPKISFDGSQSMTDIASADTSAVSSRSTAYANTKTGVSSPSRA